MNMIYMILNNAGRCMIKLKQRRAQKAYEARFYQYQCKIAALEGAKPKRKKTKDQQYNFYPDPAD